LRPLRFVSAIAVQSFLIRQIRYSVSAFANPSISLISFMARNVHSGSFCKTVLIDPAYYAHAIHIAANLYPPQPGFTRSRPRIHQIRMHVPYLQTAEEACKSQTLAMQTRWRNCDTRAVLSAWTCQESMAGPNGAHRVGVKAIVWCMLAGAGAG
jgi:hypothetical protein